MLLLGGSRPWCKCSQGAALSRGWLWEEVVKCVCAWVHTEGILTRVLFCLEERLQLAAGTAYGMRQGRLRVSSDPPVRAKECTAA